MAFNINDIYQKFVVEFIKYRKDNNYHDFTLTNATWKEFIKSKDLGIICVKADSNSSGDEYEIIDEKKWLINKIKYGF